MSRKTHFTPRAAAASGGGANRGPPGIGQFYPGQPNFNFALPNQPLPFAQNPTLPFFQNPNFHPQQFPPFQPQQFPPFQARPFSPNHNDLVGKVERAVVKARRDLVAAGQSVTAWRVSEAVLLAMQVDSWGSLGLKMQQVPSLNNLMSIEGKINAFIHCFVGVSRITTLYDLEVAICQNEGIEQFEDLELGPLVRHPLVVHYFSVNHDTTAVFEITTEEVLLCLSEFIDVHKRKDMINTEEILDYIAEKRSVIGRESLCVRVQSLGWHIFCIRKAKRTANDTLKKCTSTFNERIKPHILNSKRKQQLDDRFCAISQRVKSFSSIRGEFSGKHIKFVSSSSGDEESDDSMHEDNKSDKDEHSHFKTPSQSIKNLDQVSSCPYPSAAEEMTRLGLKGDVTCSSKCGDSDDPSQSKTPSESSLGSQQARGCSQPSREGDDQPVATSGSSKFKGRNKSFGKRWRSGFLTAPPKKKVKRDKVGYMMLECDDLHKEATTDEIGISLATDSTRMFITTWKEACRDHTVAEVLDRMLQFFNPSARQRKRMKSMFSSQPFAGLLEVAVASIKSGLWDNIYDSFQAISQDELNNSLSGKCPELEIIDVEPSEKAAPVVGIGIIECEFSVKDVMDKVATYFEHDLEMHSNRRLPVENILKVFKKLCHCESWVAEQFNVKEFNSLAHGDFFIFLEQHASMLPNGLRKILNGDKFEKSPLEVCLPEQQLVELVSQASNTLSEKKIVTKHMISMLLSRQFPMLNFKIRENGSLEDFLDIVEKQKSNANSKCVVFSAPFLGSYFNGSDESNLSEATDMRADIGNKAITPKSVTSKDAIEVLCRAPMLSDLKVWSHWNTMFAPSLGSLVEWLGNEVSKKGLWCLVTEDGKVIRINPLATVDSFLEAAVKGSSFQTAVELLSVYCIVGGEKHVPLSLLKCHARHAFEVICKNCLENVEVNDSQNILMHGNTEQIYDGVSSMDLCSKLHNNLSKMNKVVVVASKFFLNCLSYFPSDHRGFAADVLLSGLRSVIKDVHSVILSECTHLEQRIMLHDVGMSLGIVEWINDYHVFSSTNSADLSVSSEPSCLRAARSGLDSKNKQDMPDGSPFPDGNMIVSAEADWRNSNHGKVHCNIDGAEEVSSSSTLTLSELKENTDATLVIESIRREEFGLDSSLPDMEISMLRKQHARLGRALHCLSQELYSQDSHFLLELVQNADDNIYPENVEPTLTFILQEAGITILNNECGFSAANIRALCDVGNSTKKGSGAGYIGQKGIGFKSVFRVTDAPEIHSNGFHVKFDISQGQIGFVLPTLVPPCNLDLYSRLASTDNDPKVNDCWNTCIVLPFRSKLSEGSAMNSIMTMFSDLHPSLLLFLHRLQCIKFRNMVNNSLIVMRKEIVGDGIIKVSLGKEKMTWFVVSQKVKADIIRRDVKATEIAIAFTLQESDSREYKPRLDQQPAFAFLPLRTYGLKFILQGDFVLPSSREEVDGNSPWNQWLLSEFPGLFVNAERSFCALPCYRENPGKAITAYMSFVPLIGEVHGFFSSLPRMIISKLRISNCLLLEGDNNGWVPPCMVLRGWNEQAHSLLSENLLREHLGLGFLHKDIVLSDPLARALGIEEYGPKILLQVMTSLCHMEDGLKSMSLGWLSSWLSELHSVLFHSSDRSFLESGSQCDLIKQLQGIPFIPLSDGTYSSIDEGTIWLPSDGVGVSFDGENGLEAFPNIYAKLRTVNPALFAVLSVDIANESMISTDSLTRLLHRIGVQRLSSHEITMVHILSALTNDKTTGKDKNLMTEYLCFAMIHLHSNCPVCRVERDFIISELRTKAFILTNHGFKRPVDVPIHFSKEYGNPVDINKLINVAYMKWHEVDISYVKHPSTQSLSRGLLKWREFLQDLGVSDFVQIVQVDKNVADISNAALKNIVWNRDLISPGSLAKDWESQELVNLLSVLSSNGSRESCKYLLETFNILWDDYFRDKVAGYCSSISSGDSKPFKSSFIRCVCDVQWVASSIDDELHYPKDLFYDCDAVRLIMGSSAPYAVPKVTNEKLVNDIGFKTRVTLDDVMSIFKVWRSQTPFKASISQMCRLYTFILNEMAVSKRNIVQELCSEPFIFVPYASDFGSDDVITGIFFTPKELYWRDSSGTVDLLKERNPRDGSVVKTHCPLNNTLCNVYPGLRHFFIDECGVCEIPPVRSYLQILQQLSAFALPSQAAKAVFRMFLSWTDELKSGLLDSEDIIYLKECLRKLEFAILPTIQDKWVSLHPSFGLVCWCDNEKLKKEFKNSDNIDFLYFGELSSDETEMLQTKMSTLMQQLGIPALSEAVTREAIYYGPANSNLKASLVNWALPYAQRYMCSLYPDKYTHLKQSGFDRLNRLRVLVVDKLFYRNVIKSSGCVSKKRYECNCLLEDAVLYSTQESDSHSIYMELSRLLFEGIPELHLANFLHMVTTMAESGSSEEQTEFFILNSQKVPKLPDGESVWSISLAENDETPETSSAATVTNQQQPPSFKRKAGAQNWPPADWKTAPGFSYAHANGFKTQAAIQPSSGGQVRDDDDDSGDIVMKIDDVVPVELNVDWTIEDFSASAMTAAGLPDSKSMENQPAQANDWHASTMDMACDPTIDLDIVSGGPDINHFSKRDRLSYNIPNIAQAMLTGREGERVAFKYFSGKVGKDVKWVNEESETGLPYDLVIREKEANKEYIEVKATTSARKDWFSISKREWEFAVENGECYSIAHVVLSDKNVAKISAFKNPVKLCQQRQLQLVMMMPRN